MRRLGLLKSHGACTAWSVILTACALLGSGGCAGSGDPNAPRSVIANDVKITPTLDSAKVGDFRSFTVESFEVGEGNGTSVSGTLSSSDLSVATISDATFTTMAGGTFSEGTVPTTPFKVRCVGAGTAQISAKSSSANDISATATMKCLGLVPTLVDVDTGKAKAGAAAVQLHASATDASGNPVSGVTFTWSSANASIATVSSTGLATPLSPGIAVISAATSGSSPLTGKTIFTVTGPGSCSINPTGNSTKGTMKFTVQSDPGNHAAQIGFPATAITLNFDFTGSFGQQLSVGGSSPFVSVTGGWLGADCAFVANGTGTVAGQSNVGVRLQGTWTNGTLSLTYTVGTNGELSGGATVYTVTS